MLITWYCWLTGQWRASEYTFFLLYIIADLCLIFATHQNFFISSLLLPPVLPKDCSVSAHCVDVKSVPVNCFSNDSEWLWRQRSNEFRVYAIHKMRLRCSVWPFTFHWLRFLLFCHFCSQEVVSDLHNNVLICDYSSYSQLIRNLKH